MSVTKVINVEVQSGDINQLNSDLNKLDKNFKKVDNNAEKASSSLKDVGKNGGAIAVLDELTGGLATKTRDVAEATELFNFKLKGTRTALIATGIGAFVVALGLVVAYWEEITDFITGANSSLEQQLKLQQEAVKFTDARLKTLEAEKKLLEAQGLSTEEIVKQQQQLLELKLSQLELELKLTEQQLKREQASVREVTLLEKGRIALSSLLGAEATGSAVGRSVAGSEEEKQQIADTLNQIEQLRTSIAQTKLEVFQIQNPSIGAGSGTRDKVGTVSGLRGAGATELEGFAQLEIEKTNIVAENAKLRNAIQQEAADEELRIRQILQQQELAIVSDTIGQIGAILGENTAAGKAFGIAQALINTYLGVTRVLSNETTLPEPFGTINKIASIGTVLATGFQAVKDITSVQVPTQFGGSPGGGGGARGGASAPAFNVVGTSGVNQLAESLQQDQQPVQAFVVGSNVTSQQALDRNITETATLG